VYRAVNTISVIKTSYLMLYREIFAVCSQIHTKHTNTLCEQNVELLNVKLVVLILTTALRRVKKSYRRLINTDLSCWSNVARLTPCTLKPRNLICRSDLRQTAVSCLAVLVTGSIYRTFLLCSGICFACFCCISSACFSLPNPQTWRQLFWTRMFSVISLPYLTGPY
jgi:hypothetical protein